MMSLLASIAAYIGTNIDDIFILTILLTQNTGKSRRRMIAGHFLGVAVITAASMLGALGLQNLPLKYVGLLGLVPIALGIRAWIAGDDDDDASLSGRIGLASMAMITVGNGADNIGVYIPLFTGFTVPERMGAVLVFAVLTALWVSLARKLSEFPRVRSVIERYKRIAVPAVFIALGIFIILESGLLG